MILVKFPSRERAHKWFLVINGYIQKQTTNDVKYLITLDQNDNLLLAYTNYCETLKSQGVNIEYIVGQSNSKIHACNRDMDKSGDWDIVVLGSDDMICQYEGWDNVLINEMGEDTDRVLYHPDGFTQLNTMCVMGKYYYKRFNYIYHHDYISLWADNEYQEVSRILGKEVKYDTVLFKHEHFSNMSSVRKDALMTKNESFYHRDKLTYDKRKEQNFNL